MAHEDLDALAAGRRVFDDFWLVRFYRWTSVGSIEKAYEWGGEVPGAQACVRKLQAGVLPGMRKRFAANEDLDAFAAARRVFDDFWLEPDVFEQ